MRKVELYAAYEEWALERESFILAETEGERIAPETWEYSDDRAVALLHIAISFII